MKRLLNHAKQGVCVCINIKALDGLQASIPRLIFSFFCNYFIDVLAGSIIVDAPIKSFDYITSLLRLKVLEDALDSQLIVAQATTQHHRNKLLPN